MFPAVTRVSINARLYIMPAVEFMISQKTPENIEYIIRFKNSFTSGSINEKKLFTNFPGLFNYLFFEMLSISGIYKKQITAMR